MKLKIKDLMNYSRSYEELSKEKMPVALAYKLSKISKEINEQIEFYQSQYNTYLQLYAEKNEDGTFKMNEQGNGFILQKDNIEEAQKKFAELDSYDFPIESVPISLNDLAGLDVSPEVMKGLLPFLE